MRAFIIISIIAIGMVGCAGNSSVRKVDVNEVFILRPGERVTVNDRFTLRFDSVAEDSRCPEGVECVWAGNAKVMLEYQSPDHPPVGCALNTSSGYTRDTTLQSYTIALVDLKPHPKKDRPPLRDEYTAEL